MPSITTTDWEQYRVANSDIPPNIFFRVVEGGDKEENIDTELEDNKTDLIPAHKIFLAGASPVFRANFFGLMKMTGEVMVVKETTIEAFMTLINFIYWPRGNDSFSVKHITKIQDLCNIIEISERYQVSELVQIAKERLQTLKITNENLIDAALAAEKFKVFDDIQDLLTNKSVNFLQRTLTSASDVIKLMVSTNEDHPEYGPPLLLGLLKIKEARRGKIIFSKPLQNVALPGKQEPLTAAMLVQAPILQQKQMLGDHLFPLVQQLQSHLAGKITGMLLEIDNEEILHLLQDRACLQARVDEAVAVLRAYQIKTREGRVPLGLGTLGLCRRL